MGRVGWGILTRLVWYFDGQGWEAIADWKSIEGLLSG